MPAGTDWTAEENAVVVRAYLDMLRLDLMHHSYNKAEMNRRVAAETGRSRGAIEFKLRNVSQAMVDFNHPYIGGYLPASNLQDALRYEVLRQLDLAGDLPDLAFSALQRGIGAPRFDLLWSVASAPKVELSAAEPSFAPRRLDFVRIEAENRRLGLAGEQAVLRREQDALRLQGRPDLAERVEHVSQTEGDGKGFDILSFDEQGGRKFIEVKTTRRGRHWPMLISRGEVAFSQAEPDRFHLYRVHDFTEERAGLYTLQGDVSKSCRLRPDTYQALPA